MESRSLSTNYKTLYLCVALAALIFCFVSVSAPAAREDDYSQSSTTFIDYGQVPTYYQYDMAGPSNEGLYGGAKDYTGDWQFNFLASSVLFSEKTYFPDGDLKTWYQLLGPGGVFTLTGPNGLVFTATISGGWDSFRFADEYPDSWGSYEIWASGAWNDGSRTGVFVQGGGYEQGWTPATLTFVPEPGSLVLLGSGTLALAGLLRRKFSN
jgi:hypothetical protein